MSCKTVLSAICNYHPKKQSRPSTRRQIILIEIFDKLVEWITESLDILDQLSRGEPTQNVRQYILELRSLFEKLTDDFKGSIEKAKKKSSKEGATEDAVWICFGSVPSFSEWFSEYYSELPIEMKNIDGSLYYLFLELSSTVNCLRRDGDIRDIKAVVNAIREFLRNL